MPLEGAVVLDASNGSKRYNREIDTAELLAIPVCVNCCRSTIVRCVKGQYALRISEIRDDD